MLEARWARGKPEALPQLTQELIQLGVDVLVPTARPSIEAAKAATTTLPIVANDLESDPIASGYVASLARPGGNLTGVFLDAPTLCSKWLQYIDDVVPNVTKIGVLWDVTTGTFQLDAITTAAKTKSLKFMVMQFRNAAELEPTFNQGLTDNPEAIVQLGSPLIRQGAPRIAEILSSRRIPAISQFRYLPRRRWPYVLRPRPFPSLSPGQQPSFPSAARHPAGGFADRTADQVRASDQCQGRQGARRQSAGLAARHGR